VRLAQTAYPLNGFLDFVISCCIGQLLPTDANLHLVSEQTSCLLIMTLGSTESPDFAIHVEIEQIQTEFGIFRQCVLKP
jgi:hypothetical protein